jgi:uncharacterized protein (TIGR03437 family)
MFRLIAASLLSLAALPAQQDRITRRIDGLRTVKLPASVHPKAQPQYDRGPVDPSTRLGRITLVAQPSPSQQADLEELLRRQQTPSSPDYHRWLTPGQFADRFGLSAADLGKIASWLESEGFQVEELARARNWVAFSGTAQQAARVFGAGIHRYEVDGETHFANATELSIPEALEGVVGAINGLSDFQPRPVSSLGMRAGVSSSTPTSGSHALTPQDFATVYDVNPLYANGIDGTGVSIAITGWSEIQVSDVHTFRSMFGLPANDPQLVLVGPSPGTVAASEDEALLDLETASAVARNASLIYVYAAHYEDAIMAAVDRNLGQIVSTSWADCETGGIGLGRSVGQQANAQGITWLAASGDSGPAGCENTGSSAPAIAGLAVNLPASFPEVTGVGGTQFDGNVGGYWTESGSVTGYSAISYIPETSWNQTDGELVASGGGASVLFAKPDWQAGPGVPADNARDVPDVSLLGAIHTYATVKGGSLDLTGGGTSASCPAFAGVVALLNHYLVKNGIQAQPGLGNINPALYKLAQIAPSAFHDITTGDNIVPCAPGSPNCATGSFGYSAGPGYDPVTGLGSVDVYQLVTHWNNPPAATVTTLAVAPPSITLGDSVQLTATVAASGAGSAPSGTVTFMAGQSVLGTAALTAAGATAVAALTADGSQLPVGSDTISATYAGNNVYNGSSGTASIAVAPQTSAPGSSVFVSISPNPVHAEEMITLTLTEEAGVGTTFTTLTENGLDLSAEIPSIFGSANIAPFGSLSITMILPPAPALPATVQVGFGGVDANGRQWSRQVSATMLPPLQGPALALSSAPGTVQQNPAADPSCQWSQQLLLQERNGFPVQLTAFKKGAVDLSGQIDQLFGTSHLAAYGSLQAAICETGISPPQTLSYEIDGTDQEGAPISATLQGSFAGPASAPAALSASPLDVSIGVPLSGGSGTGSVAVSAGANVPWTVSVFPANSTTTWLTVAPLSGTGPAQLSLTANASGFANGVYRATLILRGTNAVPQFLEVPVTLVASASSSIRIDGITNAASFQLAAAPGMMAAVFGSQLASAPGQPTGIPLPLQLNLASVTINGVAAPLLFVSPGQLNIQIPYEAGAGPAVMGIDFNGQVAYHEFTIAPSAPGIFAWGGALAPVSSGPPGDTLSLYMTGEGDVSPFFGTNQTPPSTVPLDQLPKPVLPVAVTVGGVPAAIQFIGIPTGLLGTMINFTIPPGMTAGVQPLVVTVNGVSSPPVNLTVTP